MEPGNRGGASSSSPCSVEGESLNGPLRLGGVSKVASTSDQLGDGVNKDERYIINLQDEEYMKSIEAPRRKRSSTSNRFNITVTEDEIATDYLLPKFYQSHN